MRSPSGDEVSQALDGLTRAAADEHGADRELLDGYLPALLAVASTGRRLSAAERDHCRRLGGGAGQSGVALPALVDLYMTASRRLWPAVPELVTRVRGRQVRSAELVTIGEAVWRAADDALAALATGHVEAQRLVVRREEAARREFLDDLLSGQAHVGSLVERAQPYGLHLAAPHVVVVCGAERPIASEGRLTDWVEQAVRQRFPGRGVVVTTRGGRLVCAVSTAAGGPSEDDDDGRLLATLAGPAAAELAGTATARAAVSRAHAGPRGISRGFLEAVEALEVAQRLQLPDRVVHARSLLVYRVLMRDEAAMADLVEAVLGPLTRSRDGADRLLQTLDAYFAVGANTTAAARRLHLSVRALSYRLHRVHELTGYRASDPAQHLPLSVAVTGARLLGWPHRPLVRE